MLADDVAVELTRVARGIDIAVSFRQAAGGLQALAGATREKLGTRYYALLGRARLDGEQDAKANKDAQELFEKAYALDGNSIQAPDSHNRSSTTFSMAG